MVRRKLATNARKVKEMKKARDAQAAEAKEAKASSTRPRPEEDEVVIVKASRAPGNFSVEMVKVRAGLNEGGPPTREVLGPPSLCG